MNEAIFFLSAKITADVGMKLLSSCALKVVIDRLSDWNDFLRLLRSEFITEARNHSVELTVRVLKLVPAKIAVKLVCNSAVWITTVPASGVSQTNATVTATGTKTPHESPWAGFSVSRDPGGSAWHQSRSGWKRDWTEQKNISFFVCFWLHVINFCTTISQECSEPASES